jgi:hypothetical protein
VYQSAWQFYTTACWFNTHSFCYCTVTVQLLVNSACKFYFSITSIRVESIFVWLKKTTTKKNKKLNLCLYNLCTFKVYVYYGKFRIFFIADAWTQTHDLRLTAYITSVLHNRLLFRMFMKNKYLSQLNHELNRHAERYSYNSTHQIVDSTRMRMIVFLNDRRYVPTALVYLYILMKKFNL